MFVDTHCHLNMIVKRESDISLTKNHLLMVEEVIREASLVGVGKILTIGTSLVESINSVMMAKRFENVFAVFHNFTVDHQLFRTAYLVDRQQSGARKSSYTHEHSQQRMGSFLKASLSVHLLRKLKKSIIYVCNRLGD